MPSDELRVAQAGGASRRFQSHGATDIWSVLLIWGLAVFASGFFRDVEGGAYRSGQFVGWLFSFVLIWLGVRAIVKGREARASGR